MILLINGFVHELFLVCKFAFQLVRNWELFSTDTFEDMSWCVWHNTGILIIFNRFMFLNYYWRDVSVLNVVFGVRVGIRASKIKNDSSV